MTRFAASKLVHDGLEQAVMVGCLGVCQSLHLTVYGFDVLLHDLAVLLVSEDDGCADKQDVFPRTAVLWVGVSGHQHIYGVAHAY